MLSHPCGRDLIEVRGCIFSIAWMCVLLVRIVSALLSLLCISHALLVVQRHCISANLQPYMSIAGLAIVLSEPGCPATSELSPSFPRYRVQRQGRVLNITILCRVLCDLPLVWLE
jgi:hypothetical protein